MADKITAKRKPRWTAAQRKKWKVGDYADNHYALKQERDQLLAEVNAVKAELAEIEEEAMKLYKKEALEGARGATATGFIEEREHYNVGDRAALDKYVRRTGRVDLYQSRVSSEVALSIYEETGKLPSGVTTYVKESFRSRKA